MADRKVNRKAKTTDQKSWARTLKEQGIGLNRENDHCNVSTGAHPADQNFAGGPGGFGFSVGVYPVSAKPKHKSKCVRP